MVLFENINSGKYSLDTADNVDLFDELNMVLFQLCIRLSNIYVFKKYKMCITEVPFSPLFSTFARVQISYLLRQICFCAN